MSIESLKAEQYIEDFTYSRVEIIPIVEGTMLYHKGDESMRKQKETYFMLIPCQQELLIAKSQ